MLMPSAPSRQAISTQLPSLWLDLRQAGPELPMTAPSVGGQPAVRLPELRTQHAQGAGTAVLHSP